MSITTQISLQTSMRWLRRAMTMVLILANFGVTLLSDAARGSSADARLIGSLLLCLLLIALTWTMSRKKSGLILKSPVSFLG
jgi:uncharacterized membrane protein SirB2